ncbi:MAG TPA: hypothetical protein VNM48_22465 [Chloroflexota bacterium]|nr:hypothetical protein [Chloroflexota bacterium]
MGLEDVNWLARIKSALAHVTVVIEFCDDCGRRQPLVWTADDAVWAEFAPPDGGVLCPECFDKRADRKGVMLRWVPKVAYRKGGAGT